MRDMLPCARLRKFGSHYDTRCEGNYLGRVGNTCRQSYAETKFSGTHGDRGIFIFPVQLTTSRIGNLTRLIHTLLYMMTIHTYIHTSPLGRINASGIE